jgi:hypothetical protein
LRAPSLNDRLEAFAGSAQARPDRAQRKPEELGDLGQLELFDLEEDEDDAKVDGNRLENLAKDVVGAVLVDEIFGARGGSEEGVEVLHGVGVVSPRRASCLGGDADGGREEKRHLRPRLDVAEAAREDAEHLLGRVVDARVRDAEVAEGAPEGVVVAVDDPTQPVGAGLRHRGDVGLGFADVVVLGRSSALFGYRRAGWVELAEHHDANDVRTGRSAKSNG